MPRKSKREDILRTAYAIVASDPGGIEAVTYDRLAAETELSKSGLLYHFPPPATPCWSDCTSTPQPCGRTRCAPAPEARAQTNSPRGSATARCW